MQAQKPSGGIRMRQVFLALVIFTFAIGQAWAANLAIMDSGVDYKHKDLAAKMWSNPASQTTDADGTTYKDDTHGWNFADHNNEVIDYKYLGTFSQDCYKVFEVQGKILKGTATDEEKAWYKAKKADQEFLKELSKFGNFVHGTHVSGISSQNAEKAKLQAAKIIATEPPGAFLDRMAKAGREDGDDALNQMLLKMYLGMAAQQQGKLLTSVGKYVAAVKGEVANGSFGVSVAAVTPTVENLMKQLLGKDPTPEQVKENAIYLVEQILEQSKTFVGASPNTLFVFAAGNDGTDNDSLPTAPANLKADNTIAVAASLGGESLAVFSNYGATKVEVAAPGVTIKSTIPGDQYLELSGTSMAAPYVTNVAGLVKDANPALNPAGIKKILIGTVDVKDFLKGKVSSSGVVNTERAIAAAKSSRTMSIDQAIQHARRSVADMAADHVVVDRAAAQDLLVLPLPSTF
jgi:cell wall-associated protease